MDDSCLVCHMLFSMWADSFTVDFWVIFQLWVSLKFSSIVSYTSDKKGVSSCGGIAEY